MIKKTNIKEEKDKRDTLTAECIYEESNSSSYLYVTIILCYVGLLHAVLSMHQKI